MTGAFDGDGWDAILQNFKIFGIQPLGLLGMLIFAAILTRSIRIYKPEYC